MQPREHQTSLREETFVLSPFFPKIVEKGGSTEHGRREKLKYFMYVLYLIQTVQNTG